MRSPLKLIALAAAILAATGGVTAGVASSGACQGGDAALVGRYQVRGLLGVASTLQLKRDGTYKYTLTYGALNQAATGCWMQHGRNIALLPEGGSEITDVQTLGNTDFRGMELEPRDDGALIWDIANSGRKAVYRKR